MRSQIGWACTFQLTAVSSSGPNCLPGLFGLAVAMVDYTPLGIDPDPDSGRAIYIPKSHYSTRERRLLTFAEVLDSGLGRVWDDRVYFQHNVQLLENDPDEILDVVKEMFQRLDGVVEYTEADEHRQGRFVELRHLEDECPAPTLTRVGRDYLMKYENLLR